LKTFPEVASVSVKGLLLRSFQNTIAGMVRTFTWILLAFAAAIASAILYNAARVGFSEKSWELASLEIMGYGPRMGWWLLFSELGIQVVLAAAPGCLIGFGLSALNAELVHTETFAFPLIVNASTYARALLMLAATFFASGLVIYMMVRRLNLVEALKARE
jgi:putative ABC transport system permease protein